MAVISSCNSSKNVVYLQDLQPEQVETIVNMNKVKVQPGDNLSIIVTCKDPQIAALFNLIEPNTRLYPGGKNSTSGAGMPGYTVNSKGDIDFPQLGMLHVEGMDRSEVAAYIKGRLEAASLVKDPVVTVDFNNIYVSVIGEVAKPGRVPVTNEQMTLLEALAEAGDLTIYGKRDQVSVVREEKGKRTTYTVDLRSKDLFNSPAYYLRQNDVVYVAPNSARAGQASINDNNFKSASFWMSLASLLTTIAVLVFK